MYIQDLLGLSLQTGLECVDKANYQYKIIETFPRNKKMEVLKIHDKSPYIVRIKEVHNNFLEILVSYF